MELDGITTRSLYCDIICRLTICGVTLDGGGGTALLGCGGLLSGMYGMLGGGLGILPPDVAPVYVVLLAAGELKLGGR